MIISEIGSLFYEEKKEWLNILMTKKIMLHLNDVLM